MSEAGHSVAVFHRGETATALPREVASIIGDRRRLSDYAGELARFAPDVVIDQIAYTVQEARSLTETFRSKAGRIVAISSQDVYR
ncbi:MAG: NAD-dependent epimerase/dehydratase family protein, partial [Blastocatellia bacterium]